MPIWYNKQQAKIMSDLDKYEIKSSLRLNHELDGTSKFIVALLKENKVSTLVLGQNKGWKISLIILSLERELEEVYTSL